MLSLYFSLQAKLLNLWIFKNVNIGLEIMPRLFCSEPAEPKEKDLRCGVTEKSETGSKLDPEQNGFIHQELEE